ncbi:MAG: energy transducer TonB [Gemmatimonadales bacterium]
MKATRARVDISLPPHRRSPAGAVIAVVAHLLIFSALIALAPLRNLDFQDNAGAPGAERSGGGGGGGGRVRLVALPALAHAVVPPPPPVVPPPVPPPVMVPPIETPVVAPPAPDTVLPAATTDQPASGSGGGRGTGSGSGSGTGTGSGSGAGSGSGTGSGTGPGSGGGGTARPPEPRQLILPPPDVPKSMRGITISVTFLVGPEGRVESVRFVPEPDDRGFAKKLEEVMRNYRFRPARGPDGTVVAGTVMVQLTF